MVVNDLPCQEEFSHDRTRDGSTRPGIADA
jgi:hypothetical protein